MKITLRQKTLENNNQSLYLDIYENGKRKFEFLSLYLLPEIDAKTKARNQETLEQAQQIRAERILHPETIPQVGHTQVVPEVGDDNSPKVLDWFDTCIEWMEGCSDFAKSTIRRHRYTQELVREFLTGNKRLDITLAQFDKHWFKAFLRWVKKDYVPTKYVRIKAKPLTPGSLRNIQQGMVAIFNRAVKNGKLKANPFYQLPKNDIFPKPKMTHKQFLTPEELKTFMASEETSPGVADAQRAFGFACLTGLRISDIKALKWSDIRKDKDSCWLTIVQKKTKAVNTVPICSTAMAWLPERRTKGKDDKVFHLPALQNVDAAIKRIAKKVGIEKDISFHTSRHTFGTLVQAAAKDIETTKKLLGHRSLKSTAVYADVLTEEKVRAIANTKNIFDGCQAPAENLTIPKTKRTAATNRHPRKVIQIQDNN